MVGRQLGVDGGTPDGNAKGPARHARYSIVRTPRMIAGRAVVVARRGPRPQCRGAGHGSGETGLVRWAGLRGSEGMQPVGSPVRQMGWKAGYGDGGGQSAGCGCLGEGSRGVRSDRQAVPERRRQRGPGEAAGPCSSGGECIQDKRSPAHLGGSGNLARTVGGGGGRREARLTRSRPALGCVRRHLGSTGRWRPTTGALCPGAWVPYRLGLRPGCNVARRWCGWLSSHGRG